MSKITSKIENLEMTVAEFISRFELVFHNDWLMTKSSIDSKHLIHEDGTFLEPGVEDEENNWANRARLLESYRSLCRLMKQEKIEWDNMGPDT